MWEWIKLNIFQPVGSFFSRIAISIRDIFVGNSQSGGQYSPIPSTSPVLPAAVKPLSNQADFSQNNSDEAHFESLPAELHVKIFSKLNNNDNAQSALASISQKYNSFFHVTLKEKRQYQRFVQKGLEKLFNFNFVYTVIQGNKKQQSPTGPIMGNFTFYDLQNDGIKIKLLLPVQQYAEPKMNEMVECFKKMMEFFSGNDTQYVRSEGYGGMGSRIHIITIEKNQLENLGKKLEETISSKNNTPKIS